MLLSSYNRVRNFIADKSGNELIDTVDNKRDILNWITAVSGRVEQYLKRGVELISRTEYFDVDYKRLIYFPFAYPVDSVTSIKIDSLGQFTGSETTLDSTEYNIGHNVGSIDLIYIQQFKRSNAMQLIYTGGMALHAVNSVFAVDDGSTLTVDKYLLGETSGSFGIIKAKSEPSVTIENLYGVFISGETLTEYDDEARTTTSGETCTISSITSQALAEAYPAIVNAVEMEIRYLWKHKMDFENQETTPDGNSTRRNDATYEFQPEVRFNLQPYKRMSIG